MKLFIYSGPGMFIGARVVVAAKSIVTAKKVIEPIIKDLCNAPDNIAEHITAFNIDAMDNGTVLLFDNGEY